jgi:DNA-binding MltR family transcriptional regulator
MGKKRKPSKRNLNRFKMGDSAHENAIMQAMLEETERGAVLVGVQWLDDMLEEVLRSRFAVENTGSEIVNQLLNGAIAPLGTLGVRVAACRAFGILRQEAYEVLEALREIRNHCAHAKARTSLSDTDIAAHVRRIKDFSSERCDVGDDLWACVRFAIFWMSGTLENTNHQILHIGLPASRPLGEHPK